VSEEIRLRIENAENAVADEVSKINAETKKQLFYQDEKANKNFIRAVDFIIEKVVG